MSLWGDIGHFLGNIFGGGNNNQPQLNQYQPQPILQAQQHTAPQQFNNPVPQATQMQQQQDQAAQAHRLNQNQDINNAGAGTIQNTENQLNTQNNKYGVLANPAARAAFLAGNQPSKLNLATAIPEEAGKATYNTLGKPVVKTGAVSYDIGKDVAGIATGNQQASRNAVNQAVRDYSQSIPGIGVRAVTQFGESVPVGNYQNRTINPQNPYLNAALGGQIPTYETQLKQNILAGKNPALALVEQIPNVAGGALSVLGAAEGVKKVAENTIPLNEVGSAKVPNLNADMFSKENIAKYEKENATDAAKLKELPKVTPLEAAQNKQLNMRSQLSDTERSNLLNTEAQKTTNDVKLGATTEKGAIGEVEGIANERLQRFNKGINTGTKLRGNDLAQLDNVLTGKKAVGQNAAIIQKTADQLHDAYDYSLAADRAGGSKTLRFNQGKYSPLYFKGDDALAEKMGVPESDRIVKGGQTIGFRYQARNIKSYADAPAGLERLNNNALEDARMYAQNGQQSIHTRMLESNLQRLYPKEFSADRNVTQIGDNKLIPAAGGNLPFNVSQRLDKFLNGYKSAKLNNPIAEAGLKAVQYPAQELRKAAFIGAPIHYINTARSFLDTTLPSLHGAIATKGLGEAFGAALHPKIYEALEKSAEESGVRDFARKAGMVELDTRPNLVKAGTTGVKAVAEKYSPFAAGMRNMNRWINTLTWKLAEGAKNTGVDPLSERGQKVGNELNYVMDRINSKVQGLNPVGERLASTGSLAPHWIRANIGLVGHAVKESIPGIGSGSKGFGLSTAGDIARSNVLGGRALNAAIAITASAIAAGKLPTLTQAAQEGGFLLNNPNPNVSAGQTKPTGVKGTGESQVMNLPTDAVGMATTLITDPVHFFTARETPALSAGTQFVTGKDFNGNYTYDVNASKATQEGQKAVAAAKALLPFSVQNVQNKNLDTAQKLAQTFGLRTKTDPNDPRVKGAIDFYNAMGSAVNQANPNDKNLITKYMSRQLDSNGTKISEGTVGGYDNAKDLLTNANTGGKALQLVYNAEHGLKNGDPLWQLPLTAAEGQPSVTNYLKVQSQYEGDEKTGMKTREQGDPIKGWITDLGNARAAYYSKLPPSTAGAAKEPTYPAFDTQTTADMKAADGIADPTKFSQFLTTHQNVTDAFSTIAQWTNQIRQLEGGPPLPATQQATPQLQQIMNTYNALPPSKTAGNTNKATSGMRAAWIKANPDAYQQMTTFYANSSLTSLLKNSIKAVYSGDNIANQAVLKDVKSAGQDVVKNANGSYSVNPAAAYAASSGGKYSGSSGSPYLKFSQEFKGYKLKVATPKKLHLQASRDYFKGAKVKAKIPKKGKQPGLPIATF